MTYEEAKERISNFCVGCVFTSECDDCEYPMLVKALEKQIPKKPTYKEETSIVFGKHKAPYCPCCGDSWNCNEFGESMKYCWECGQAIDWSEENEVQD